MGFPANGGEVELRSILGSDRNLFESTGDSSRFKLSISVLTSVALLLSGLIATTAKPAQANPTFLSPTWNCSTISRFGNCVSDMPYSQSGAYSWVVPAGVLQIRFSVRGGSGGSSGSLEGGTGAQVDGWINTQPGETIYFIPGSKGTNRSAGAVSLAGTSGAGGSSSFGGGGGAASSIRMNLNNSGTGYEEADRVAVAGGGGGAGDATRVMCLGQNSGGDAGSWRWTDDFGSLSAGAGLSNCSELGLPLLGGRAGMDSRTGASGVLFGETPVWPNPGNGDGQPALATPANYFAANLQNSSGGGGGGYFGGGGGAGGGGGGGSSFTHESLVERRIISKGSVQQHGSISVIYQQMPVSTSSPTISGAPLVGGTVTGVDGNWNNNGQNFGTKYQYFQSSSASGPWTALTQLSSTLSPITLGSDLAGKFVMFRVTRVTPPNVDLKSVSSDSAAVGVHGPTSIRFEDQPFSIQSNIAIGTPVITSGGHETVTLVDGSLPPGFNIRKAWEGRWQVLGRSTVPGVYNFSLRATNQNDFSTASFSITVLEVPVVSFSRSNAAVTAAQITGSALTVGTAITPFSFSVQAGAGPITSLYATLPEGLSLDSATRTISGTPLVSSGTDRTEGRICGRVSHNYDFCSPRLSFTINKINPIHSMEGVTDLTSTSATILTKINPGGLSQVVSYKVCKDSALTTDCLTGLSVQSSPARASDVTLSKTVETSNGLASGTTYYAAAIVGGVAATPIEFKTEGQTPNISVSSAIPTILAKDVAVSYIFSTIGTPRPTGLTVTTNIPGMSVAASPGDPNTLTLSGIPSTSGDYSIAIDDSRLELPITFNVVVKKSVRVQVSSSNSPLSSIVIEGNQGSRGTTVTCTNQTTCFRDFFEGDRYRVSIKDNETFGWRSNQALRRGESTSLEDSAAFDGNASASLAYTAMPGEGSFLNWANENVQIDVSQFGISPIAMGSATRNLYYISPDLEATGDSYPLNLTWTISQGTLPGGLSLGTNPETGKRVIVGWPSVNSVGTHTFAVRATKGDGSGTFAERTLSLTIQPDIKVTINVLNGTLDEIIAGAVSNELTFSDQLKTCTHATSCEVYVQPGENWSVSFKDSRDPFSWVSYSNSRPRASTISNSRQFWISDTNDADNPLSSAVFAATEDVTVDVTLFAVNDVALPEATVGVPYESPAMTAVGRTEPVSWSVTGGSLPVGLTLSPQTGKIVGTPTEEATTAFAVSATTNAGTPTLEALSNGLILRVLPAPAVVAPPAAVAAPGPAPAQVIPQMIAQAGPGLPARLKRGKTVRFGMTAPSGLPLRVTSIGRCKTTAITKRVTVRVLEGKKIKKKRVKVQTGWAVKATRKKGNCTVTFSNPGDATRSPLASAGTITVF
jgi:hypothetical protein